MFDSFLSFDTYLTNEMKRFLAAILILLVFSQNLKAQNEDLEGSRFELTIMPYSLIDYSPRLRMGLEYYSSDRLGYSLDFGYGNGAFNELLERDWGEDYSLFEFRAELKYFFILKEYFAMYSGIELFSIYTEDAMEFDWYRKEHYPENYASNMITRYDFAQFERQKYGAHFKFGVKLVAFKKVDFDFYAGLGVAHRTIRYSEIVNPVDEEYNPFNEWFSDRNANEGESFFLHIALGIKVGFILCGK